MKNEQDPLWLSESRLVLMDQPELETYLLQIQVTDNDADLYLVARAKLILAMKGFRELADHAVSSSIRHHAMGMIRDLA